MSFADKVIIITGASDGIGAELARQLAPERPRLVLAARRMDALQSVVAQCVTAGAETAAMRCDVGVEDDCRALVENAIARHGRIDVLVNNAGFFEALRTGLMGSGVDVTVVFPGVVATNIRLRGYGADGKPAGRSGLKEKRAMPVEECARQIIAALRARRRELVMTARAKIGLWFKLIAPGIVDKMARAALAKSDK